MRSISVITATAREDSLKLAKESLDRQTLLTKGEDEFEWIIISPIADKFHLQQASYPVKILKDPPKKKGNYWSLNAAYNKAIREAQGELIVFLQDFIMISPTGLEQFWEDYEKTNGCITGVGDQYESVDEMGKPTVKVWSDPRKRLDQGSFYECNFVDFELNWGCSPKKVLVDIGGFDEDLDKFAGMDNISVAERLNDIGVRFYIDQSCESFTVRHERLPDWDRNHAMHGAYEKRKRELKKQSVWPRLSYLK